MKTTTQNTRGEGIVTRKMQISSPAFLDGESIPSRYTCEGHDISPPIHIERIPPGTRSLVLIVDDPDAPNGNWVHWLVWNIPVTHHLNEGEVNGVEGLNDFKQQHYGGPCPPSGSHRYFFRVYALDDLLELSHTSRKPELEDAMKAHIIGKGELVGIYRKKS